MEDSVNLIKTQGDYYFFEKNYEKALEKYQTSLGKKFWLDMVESEKWTFEMDMKSDVLRSDLLSFNIGDVLEPKIGPILKIGQVNFFLIPSPI